MHQTFQRVAILGADHLGCELAAQYANCGLPVYLFDMAATSGDPKHEINDRLSKLHRCASSDIYIGDNYHHYIHTRTFQSDCTDLLDCDMVICAMRCTPSERQALWLRLAHHFHTQAAIVVLNANYTLATLTDGLPESIRQRLVAAHWARPLSRAAYVGISPSQDTIPQLSEQVERYFAKVMGKRVRFINDPCFGIIPHFVGHWLWVVYQACQSAPDYEDELLAHIPAYYSQALLPSNAAAPFSAAELSQLIEQAGLAADKVPDFLEWLYRHAPSSHKPYQSPDSQSAIDTNQLVVDELGRLGHELANYLKARSEALDIDLDDLVGIIGQQFKLSESSLDAFHQVERSRSDEKSIHVNKGIAKLFSDLSVHVDNRFGAEIRLHPEADTELNTKQLIAFNELCLKQLNKLDDHQALVIRLHDYAPNLLPSALFDPKRAEQNLNQWFQAWNDLYRLLFSRAVPTIVTLSGETTGFAAGCAIYGNGIITNEQLNLLPICRHEDHSYPTPGYAFGLAERLTWQRGRLSTVRENAYHADIPRKPSRGAVVAKQKGWLPRHAMVVANESNLSEVVNLYRQLQNHMLSWSASLPRYDANPERHPWQTEYVYYQENLQSAM